MAVRPGQAARMVRAGLAYERARLLLAPGKGVPAASTYLNRLAVSSVADALAHPGRTVWANLFAPTELLHAMGLVPLSIESFSAFMGGFHIEGALLAAAGNAGLSDTLCAYHKCFIGAALSGILQKPLLSMATTLACDANANTFRFLERRFGVRAEVIDVPYESTEEAVGYVERQLERAVCSLEEAAGGALDMAALRRVIECENRTREMHAEALSLSAERGFPSTLTLTMFRLFATHLLLGTPGIERYYERLLQELRAAPVSDALRVLWVHLQPFHQESLRRHFNHSHSARIVATDFDVDCTEPLDAERPLRALAEKLVANIYNGPYARKADAVLRLADAVRPDGVVHFCHWGCKQAAGGGMELAQAFAERGIPFLALDGDGLDRRNSPDGQIATRADAFMEMLWARRAAAKGDRH